MNFSGDAHFRDALPIIQQFAVVVQANLPLIQPGFQWQHGEGEGEYVEARVEDEVGGGPRPHELPYGCYAWKHIIFPGFEECRILIPEFPSALAFVGVRWT